MKTAIAVLLFVPLFAAGLIAQTGAAQTTEVSQTGAAQTGIDKLTTSNLPSFLKTFQSDVEQVNKTFEHLSHASMPMFDAKGETLGRRKIKDRQQTVIDLKKTLDDFESRPDNLVVTMTLSAQTEELADELYDLTEIAYDNDQEETALDLTRLLGDFNDDAGLIQAYALNLASQKEERLNQLEKGRS